VGNAAEELDLRHGTATQGMQDILDAVATPVVRLDAEHGAMLVNRAWLALSGLDRESSLGDGWLTVLSSEARRSARSLTAHTGASGQETSHALDWELLDLAGTFRSVQVQTRPDFDGSPGSVLLTLTDVTHRRAREADLMRRATCDPLTELQNREVFVAQVDHALQRRARTRTLAAVLFVDLDRFKSVNDGFGHQVGDRVLRAASERIVTAVRSCDSVARLGGDEFAVLCEDLTHPGEAGIIAERILRSFQAPFCVDDDEIALGASIGVAHAEDHDTTTQLLTRSDEAMYRVKQAGGGGCDVATPERVANPPFRAGVPDPDPADPSPTADLHGRIIQRIHAAGVLLDRHGASLLGEAVHATALDAFDDIVRDIQAFELAVRLMDEPDAIAVRARRRWNAETSSAHQAEHEDLAADVTVGPRRRRSGASERCPICPFLSTVVPVRLAVRRCQGADHGR
jgi:diguanylate cyclase (GGDEF)-like protein/PAS domain S-box-containing protein